MFTFLILTAVVLFTLVHILETPLTQKIKDHMLGFVIYYFIFAVIVVILNTTRGGIFALNDFFASILLIIGLIVSFGIFLTNRDFFPINRATDNIAKIPHYIPFSHAFKSYLFSLIKVKYKVKVLIKAPNDGNYNWILHQISAYNEIIEKNIIGNNLKDSIEFILLENNEIEIKELFEKLETDRYNYIIITSLSAIFREAITQREKLNDYKSRVKIIGALSSISNDKINNIINNDDDIIRVFPPDYDEANTAINFMFYRIISKLCPEDKLLELQNKRNNIVVIHSGSYGSAISRQCNRLYYIEKRGLKYFIENKDKSREIMDNINYYSFNFTNDEQFIDDSDNRKGIKELLDSTKEDKNWFYIVGYEPNVSNILRGLNTLIDKSSNSNFLFCGTSSMISWRESIMGTILNLDNIQDKNRYYLKLKICNVMSSLERKELSCKIKFKYKQKSDVSIDEVLSDVNIKVDINSYCNVQENYISILTKDSLKIAQEVIDNPEKTLLSAKHSVLSSYEEQEIKLLVNGDSINQYEVEKMN